MGGLLGAGFFCQGRSVGRVEVKYLWVGILPSSLFASLGLFILGWLSTRETIIPLSKCKVMEEEQAWSGALPLLKVILLGKGRKRKMSSPNVDSLKKKMLVAPTIVVFESYQDWMVPWCQLVSEPGHRWLLRVSRMATKTPRCAITPPVNRNCPKFDNHPRQRGRANIAAVKRKEEQRR